MAQRTFEFDPDDGKVAEQADAFLQANPNFRIAAISHTLNAARKLVALVIFASFDDTVFVNNYQYPVPSIPGEALTPSDVGVEGIPGSAQRLVASGQTSIVGGAMVQVVTFTKNADERVWIAVFGSAKSSDYLIANDASNPGGDTVHYRLRRTTGTDEAQLEITNGSGDVTIDWAIIGIVP